MEIEDGHGYGFSFFGDGPRRLPIAARLFFYYVLCGYQLVYAIQYMFAKGNTVELLKDQLLIGTFFICCAGLEALYATIRRNYAQIRPKALYFLFLAGNSMVIVLLWEQHFNKAALFAVITLGFATWIFAKDSLLHPGPEKEAVESYSPEMPVWVNKRRLRRKKNKNKSKRR